MRARLGIVVGAAALLTAADMSVNAALPSQLSHHRSATWAAVSLVLLVVSPLAARLPSRLLAFAAGIFAAGLAGNLVSAGLHRGDVPNPFVAGNAAFNLADTLLLAGIVLGIVATMRLAARYRHLLPRHTIPVRFARYVAARCAAARSG